MDDTMDSRPETGVWPSSSQPPQPPPPLGATAVPSPSASPSEPQAVFQMGQLAVSSDNGTSTVRASNFVSINRGARPPTPLLGTNGANGARDETVLTSADAPAAAAEKQNVPSGSSAKAMKRKRAKERKRLAAEAKAAAAADGGLSGPDTSDGGAPLHAASAPAKAAKAAAAPAKAKGKYYSASQRAKRAEWRNNEAQRRQLQKQQKEQKLQNKALNQPPPAQPQQKAKPSKKKKQQAQNAQPPTDAVAAAAAVLATREGPPTEPAPVPAPNGAATEQGTGANDLPAFFDLSRFDGLRPGPLDPPSPAGPRPSAGRARSPVRPPSAASGGVPEPTAAYLAAAAQDPVALPPSAPQPLLVVIDLNGTLLYRPSRHKQPRRFVPRPHAAEFLRHCLRHFAVVVWSSARPENVDAMWRELLAAGDAGSGGSSRKAPGLVSLSTPPPPPPPPPVAVWGRDRFGLSRADYNQRVQCYKRLSTVWGNPIVAASFPGPADPMALAGHAHGWTQANTVLIDDSLEKARSEPHNLIAIPEYAGGSETPPVLPLVRDYLQTLRFQQNVSAYMRANPFRTPAKGKRGQ